MRWNHAAVVLAATAIIAVALIVRPRIAIDAAPEYGSLTLTPAAASPGGHIEVAYRAAASLSAYPELHLRASYVSIDTSGLKTGNPGTVTTLVRGPDGIFRGAFELPPAVVYGRFAVETADGSTVDSDGGRLWEILTAASDGRPSFAGLLARYQALGFFRSEEQLATARRMIALYPDRPEGWRFVIFGEAELAGPSSRDSVLARYRPAFRRLDAALSSRPVEAEAMGHMALLAESFGDSAATRIWRNRAAREFPRAAATVQQRVFTIFERTRAADERLRALDALWQEVGGGSLQLGFDGFRLAVDSRDPTLVERWGERLTASIPGTTGTVGAAYVALPGLRERGLNLLRTAVGAAADSLGQARPLDVSRATYRAMVDERRSRALAILGQALLASGDGAAALDTLTRAARLDWNPDAFRSLAQAAATVGDSASATRWAAYAAADPATSRAWADSARRRVRTASDSARWAEWTDSAVTEMRAAILARAVHGRVRGNPRLTDAAGKTVADAWAARGTSAVAFVSRTCPPSLAQFSALGRAADGLRRLGVPLVVVVEESASDTAAAAYRARGLALPVVFDVRGTAGRALGQVGTPDYFVVDAVRALRFESRSPDDMLRQAAALTRQ